MAFYKPYVSKQLEEKNEDVIVLPSIFSWFPERSEVVSERVSVEVIFKNLNNSTKHQQLKIVFF